MYTTLSIDSCMVKIMNIRCVPSHGAFHADTLVVVGFARRTSVRPEGDSRPPRVRANGTFYKFNYKLCEGTACKSPRLPNITQSVNMEQLVDVHYRPTFHLFLNRFDTREVTT